ncbi:FAD-dependent oxidoreductase [Caballeronia sp. GACF5]|uniref:NAD(P)/FAD-dependent oxidoreductase n=1 Tax=Caballeronia sp. GACF5 TaxID=2921746 RepID=UPI002028C93D|nr:FAD-dependent oxidoreductase [Caballeronia sp. GACF5]
MPHEYDVIVVGAGMVGAAIGYGLAGGNSKLLMVDGADTDFRAAKANFGLVWVQGKGLKDPSYRQLTIAAARAWPEFAKGLQAESGINLAYEQNGGLVFCLGEGEFSARTALVNEWNSQTPDCAPLVHMLDRTELRRRFPSMRLGDGVVGASFGELDGQVNPLRLLSALQTAYLRRGGRMRCGQAVTGIQALREGGFEVTAGSFQARGERVVIAAGLGSAVLGPMVGLDVPVRPQRGQLLVTERLAPLLPLANSGLRQNIEGTIMIGATSEDAGYDLATTTVAAAGLARRAVRILPDLANAKVVRQWSCLRVMTPDGSPVYATSVSHPGAEIAVCHSGVTLASFHAGAYAKAVACGSLPGALEPFHHERFNVQEA